MPSINVDVNVNTNNADSLDNLKNELTNIKQNAKETEETLSEWKGVIEDIDSSSIDVPVDVDDEQVDKTKEEIEELDEEDADVGVKVDDDELQKTKEEIDEEDGRKLTLGLDIQNVADGIRSTKQGIQELKANLDEVAQAGMQSEQNFAFLQMNLGAEKAKKTMQDINSTVASMPGDDNTMRSVLSTAQALGNDLKPQEMADATNTMADYMSASATMGKMAVESQQDIMKYLLDGNTAELERGSIVSSRVDKLKEASTFMERQQAMQEVLNELGYGGIASQDTMLNKQAEWEGMIYNSQDALSSMWLGAEKGAMDYIIQLNDASNGIVGMGIVAGQMLASPLTDIMTGIGQIGTGFKALGEINVFEKLKGGIDKVKGGFDSLRTAMGTGRRMLDALRNSESISAGVKNMLAIATGAEATAEEAGTVAKSTSIIPTVTLAGAEMSLLIPILLVAGAILVLVGILWYLYNNNKQVKQGIDSLIATFQGVFNSIMTLIGAVITAIIPVIQEVMMHIQNIINIFTTLIEGDVSLEKAVFLTWIQIQNIIQTVTQFILGILASFAQMLWTFIFQGFTRAKLTIITQVNLWKLQAIQGARNVVNGVANTLANLPSRISSAMGGIVNAITKPFTDAYNAVAREVDKIKNKAMEVANNPLSIFEGVDYEGFDDNAGFEGFNSNTLNSSLSTGNGGRSSKVTNNFHINGIIEESASEYIVNSVNGYMKKQNLMRGL